MDKWIEKEISIKEIKHLLKENNIEITSPDGWVEISKYIDKGFDVAWKLEINNKEILSSGKHLYETNVGWVFAEKLNEKIHKILCEDGLLHSFKISKTDKKIKKIDLSINHPNHRYFTNGVSSHNTNVGKSITLCSMSVDALLQNHKVLYITLEMSEEKIMERIVSNLLDYEINSLKNITWEEYDKRLEKIKSKIKSKFLVKEFPADSFSSNKIRNLLKEIKTKSKFIPDLIFVDYLGLMVPNNIKINSNSNEFFKIVSVELRAIAQEYGIPIISAVQTNRDGINKASIDLTEIAESIAVTNTADLIISITQTEEYKEANKFSWQILKNRYGIKGIKFNVCIDYTKMRIFSDETEEERFSKETPKKNTSIVDDAAVDIIKGFSNDRKAKRSEFFSSDIEM